MFQELIESEPRSTVSEASMTTRSPAHSALDYLRWSQLRLGLSWPIDEGDFLRGAGIAELEERNHEH